MINPISANSTSDASFQQLQKSQANAQQVSAQKSAQKTDQTAQTQPPQQPQQASSVQPQPLSPVEEQNLYQQALIYINGGNIASAQRILQTLQSQNPALAARLQGAFPKS